MLYAIAQLRSQFEAVVMDSDLARTFNEKISPVTTLCAVGLVSFNRSREVFRSVWIWDRAYHAMGPQDAAKKKM